MRLNELTDGQTVRYRLGRAGLNAPDWNEWKSGTLFVRRRESDLSARNRARCSYWRAGDILELTPREEEAWAGYTQADYQGDGLFLAEDYYMEIEGLEGGQNASN